MAKTRKDINALNDAEVSDYIHALNILRQRSAQNPDDETGYAFQAALHNDELVGPCEHGNDRFLAWHRAHLHYLEKLLQETDAPRTSNITIPYWDWIHKEARARKYPDAFYVTGLNDTRNETNLPLPPDTLEIVTREPDWNAFGGYPRAHPGGDYGRLEIGPHNYMHPTYIGGKMADPQTAAEDAIYWSFHCFIDLMWAEWQRRNSSPPPTSPEDDLRGFLTQPRHKIRDFQNTTELDYEYEYNDRLKVAFGVIVPPPSPLELVAEKQLQPLFVDSVETTLREESKLRFEFPASPSIPAAASVRLQDLKVPTAGSYTLRAFAYPKDVLFAPDNEEFQRQYYVGYACLWRAHASSSGHGGHGGHGHPPQPHHPTSCTLRFDVSKVLAGKNQDAISNFVLTLEYLPAPTPTGEPADSPPGLLKEVEWKNVMMEVYS